MTRSLAAPSAPAPRVFAPRGSGGWLFGREVDLLVFGGSALCSVLLLLWAWGRGGLAGETPPWFWLVGIVAVDVAHVWSTGFRVYLDGDELRRRPALYVGTPVAVFGVGALLHAASPLLFWRVLAYAAVFHFVRQQVGWITLYRRRESATGPLDVGVDTAAGYAATVWPLLHWHAHLPRNFTWFLEGDFLFGAVPGWFAAITEPVYWTLLLAFGARQLWRWARGLPVSPGKLLVVGTTWLCWWLGIVVLNGDFAFTVTNVLIHGVPYLALTYRWGRARGRQAPPGSLIARAARGGLAGFLGLVLLAAMIEEVLWDRWVWHDREAWFGVGPELSAAWLTILVPLLAVPQATHYVLDGFIWRGVAGRPDRGVVP
ncbi:MAG TPA: hypothetical protein RMF84_17125 [Polyangiaceae bacterium LLY-WYZ-14_1]|nr:hypothetical protein [Polyangiaceae bacterium LLY-WYZ-14_1]